MDGEIKKDLGVAAPKPVEGDGNPSSDIIAKRPLTEEMKKKLKAPLPEEAVEPHPTKPYLSTIKAIYVVERLNEVFGIGGWNVSTEIVETKQVDTITKSGEKRSAYWIVMKGCLRVRDYAVLPIEQYGGNDNEDLGDAYKGAATDVMTKIASYLEIGIDVFKGKHGSKGGRSQSKEDERPWLTEDQFNEMLKTINKGGQQLVKNAMRKYRMKNVYRDTLEKAIANKGTKVDNTDLVEDIINGFNEAEERGEI